MKEGKIDIGGAIPTEAELAQINALTRRQMSADEVYVFSVVLCDNEIDRDFERFSIDALNSLAKMYVGKSGIFDHSMQGKDQIARIFSCEVESFPDKITKAGEVYHRIKARAYMPKSEKNEDMILEIDAGIKKEVSVGCSVGNSTCSICGADLKSNPCGHKRGRHYKVEGKKQLCHAILSDPKDAYEWSFVAVPAQRGAGVIKGYKQNSAENFENLDVYSLCKSIGAGQTLTLCFEQVVELEKQIESLRKRADIADAYEDSLREQATRLYLLQNPDIPQNAAQKAFSLLNCDELVKTISALKKSLDDCSPITPQITAQVETQKNNDNNNYKI